MGTLAVAAALAIAPGRDGSTGITQSPPSSREAVLSGVSSSTALSTSPTDQADATPSNDTYLVQPGDTLRGIARSVYGDELQWRRIFDANRAAIPDEDQLSVGQVLVIPRP